MNDFPGYRAGKADVQRWLASWFTDRDLKTSRLTSDKSLYVILKNCTWDGNALRSLSISDMEKHLVSWGMADYAAARLVVDIASQKEKERRDIIPTPNELPSTESREEFIDSLPQIDASSNDISEWLCSWFDEFNFRGRCVHAENVIATLGLDGVSFRSTLKHDKHFIVGTLHIHNGFSWPHMLAIAADVREAMARETKLLQERKRKFDAWVAFRAESEMGPAKVVDTE